MSWFRLRGCILGALLAHAMFDLPCCRWGRQHARAGAQVLSEVVATFALVAAHPAGVAREAERPPPPSR